MLPDLREVVPRRARRTFVFTLQLLGAKQGTGSEAARQTSVMSVNVSSGLQLLSVIDSTRLLTD